MSQPLYDSTRIAEINYDMEPKTGPEELAEKLIALESKLARDIEKYTDEAVGECLLSGDQEILSKYKKAIFDDDQDLWVEASKELFLEVRQYLHSI